MAGILFDLDGTLADSRECLTRSIDYAFSNNGYAGISYCNVSSLQQDLKTTYRMTLERHGLMVDERQMEKFVQDFRWYHEFEAEDLIRAYEGIENTLEALAEKNILGVATTKHTSQAKRVLKSTGLHRFFKHIQGTDPGMRYKPDPQILELSLSTLNQSRANSVYIGDGVHDMHAARSAGIKAIGAAYGFGGDSRLKDQPHDYLIYHHRELLPLFSVRPEGTPKDQS